MEGNRIGQSGIKNFESKDRNEEGISENKCCSITSTKSFFI